jgi:hypothetical protein
MPITREPWRQPPDIALQRDRFKIIPVGAQKEIPSPDFSACRRRAPDASLSAQMC